MGNSRTCQQIVTAAPCKTVCIIDHYSSWLLLLVLKNTKLFVWSLSLLYEVLPKYIYVFFMEIFCLFPWFNSLMLCLTLLKDLSRPLFLVTVINGQEKRQTHCLQNFVRLRTLLVTGLMSCSRACMKSSLLTSSFSMADGSISTLLAALMRRFMAVDCAARTSPSSSAPLKFLVITASSFTDINPLYLQ